MKNNEPSTSTQDNNLGKRKRPPVNYVQNTKDERRRAPSIEYTPREKYDCYRSKEAEEALLVTKDKSDTESILIQSNSDTPSPPNLAVPSFSNDLIDEHGYARFVFQDLDFFRTTRTFLCFKKYFNSSHLFLQNGCYLRSIYVSCDLEITVPYDSSSFPSVENKTRKHILTSSAQK